jgi:predicted dienelactone hydrolase
MCGQIYMGGRTFFDPRIKVGIAFSPSPSNAVESKKAFAHMTLPMLYWTGTRDDAPAFASNVKAAQRRIPFDVGSGNDEYLVILTDADHMVFNGPAATELFKSQEAQTNATVWLGIINKGTTAFLDKYLKHDTARGKYLDEDGGFAKDLGQLGTFEKKRAGGR